MSKVGVLALCLGLNLLPAFALAADVSDHGLEQLLIESASTPQQHAALANHFRAKAAEAREEAAWHRKMASMYGAGKLVTAQAQREHCEKLAAVNESAAQEYDKLAEGHDAQAKK